MAQELNVKLALIDLALTDLCALVQLDSEEILSSDVAEESVSMTASVLSTEPALILTADHLVRTLVVRTLNARPGTMELSAPVRQDMSATH